MWIVINPKRKWLIWSSCIQPYLAEASRTATTLIGTRLDVNLVIETDRMCELR